MRNDPQIDDPVLAEHVSRIIDEETRRAGVSTEAILNGCKRVGDVRAREAIVLRLRSTVEMRACSATTPDGRHERRFQYRILAGPDVLHEPQAAFSKRTRWRPISTPRIAHLLRVDHSTVVYILRRLNGYGK